MKSTIEEARVEAKLSIDEARVLVKAVQTFIDHNTARLEVLGFRADFARRGADAMELGETIAFISENLVTARRMLALIETQLETRDQTKIQPV